MFDDFPHVIDPIMHFGYPPVAPYMFDTSSYHKGVCYGYGTVFVVAQAPIP